VKIIQNKIGADENVIFKGYAVGFASYLIASGEYEIESKL
jgi:hypothetical protein